MGIQVNSRKRSGSVSSFGRAERFPAPKPAAGTVSEECMEVRSAFGDQRSGRRGDGVHVGFGKSRREGPAHTGTSREGGGKPNGGLNLPHPKIATRQELLRFGDNLDKNV